MMKYLLIFGLFVALATAIPISDDDSLETDFQADVQEGAPFGFIKKAVKSAEPMSYSTPSYGGNGGHLVDMKCKPGAWITEWTVHASDFVNEIWGWCNDGMPLRRCGGDGGRTMLGPIGDSDSTVAIRYGRYVDKFKGFGGNGGRPTVLKCGSKYRANGYRFRCGGGNPGKVHKVSFHCKLKTMLDKEKAVIDAAKRRAAAAAAAASKAANDPPSRAASAIAAAKIKAWEHTTARLAKAIKDARAKAEAAKDEADRLAKLEAER